MTCETVTIVNNTTQVNVVSSGTTNTAVRDNTAQVVVKNTNTNVVVLKQAATDVVTIGIATQGAPGTSFVETFETVSRNLNVYPYTLNYNAGKLNTIVYDLGSGQSITKTFTYTSDLLTSITLSGDLPPALTQTTKTFTYSGTTLSAINYS